jgi:hypothetical protein
VGGEQSSLPVQVTLPGLVLLSTVNLIRFSNSPHVKLLD